jgi:hypothetical protein
MFTVICLDYPPAPVALGHHIGYLVSFYLCLVHFTDPENTHSEFVVWLVLKSFPISEFGGLTENHGQTLH